MKLTIPSLRHDMLSDLVPTRTYAGGWLTDPSQTLCVWHSHRFSQEQVRGAVLGFYVDDVRFEALWARQEAYARCFKSFGWGALIEVDFSVWRDRPLLEQVYAVYKMRTLSRLYQEHGIPIIPNLTWGDERSYEFCFAGLPRGCPVAACECRSVGKEPESRALFLRGLAEAIRRVAPQHVVIYGGADKSAAWVRESPPTDTQFVLLPSWSAERDRYQRSLNPNYRQRHRRGEVDEQASIRYISQ